MAKTIHIHYSVEWLLSKNDKVLLECVRHPDGAEGARKDLTKMLESGEKCLVLDNTCDNKNPDGSCAGHSMNSTKVPDDVCPTCEHKIDAATPANGVSIPSPGDITICCYCGEFLTYDESMKHLKLSVEDFVELDLDTRNMLSKARQSINHRNKNEE